MLGAQVEVVGEHRSQRSISGWPGNSRSSSSPCRTPPRTGTGRCSPRVEAAAGVAVPVPGPADVPGLVVGADPQALSRSWRSWQGRPRPRRDDRRRGRPFWESPPGAARDEREPHLAGGRRDAGLRAHRLGPTAPHRPSNREHGTSGPGARGILGRTVTPTSHNPVPTTGSQTGLQVSPHPSPRKIRASNPS